MSEHGSPHGPERVFEALPPSRGRGFAGTWWGRTWLQALEDTALDGTQLRRGRTLARQGGVGAVSVRPGRCTAVVRGRDGVGYRADVLLREFTTDEWTRLVGAVAAESGHLAALLDRELPPRLAEDAVAVGVELLPGIGDLDAECECDSWDHCVHTSALCYQLARLLDEDPFVLMLLRGRGEQELLDDVQQHGTTDPAGPAQEAERAGHPPAGRSTQLPGQGVAAGGPSGVPASEVYALSAVLPAVPPPPELPEAAGTPPALGGTSAAAGLDTDALEFLAANAAARARRMLAEALSSGHADTVVTGPLSTCADAVRLLSAGADGDIAARLAVGCGRTRTQLQPAVRAWELGGAVGLTVLAESWSPGPGELARARDQLAAAWAEDETLRPRVQAHGARWTVADSGVQLRYGPDGRWWPYRRHGAGWWPAGGPEGDPGAALSALLPPC